MSQWVEFLVVFVAMTIAAGVLAFGRRYSHVKPSRLSGSRGSARGSQTR